MGWPRPDSVFNPFRRYVKAAGLDLLNRLYGINSDIQGLAWGRRAIDLNQVTGPGDEDVFSIPRTHDDWPGHGFVSDRVEGPRCTLNTVEGLSIRVDTNS